MRFALFLVFLASLFTFKLAAGMSQEEYLKSREQFLRDIDATEESNLFRLDSAVTITAAEEFLAPMGEVFNQGNTQWCWAYSSFHTMRTYYLNTSDSSDEVTAWSSTIKDIDTASDFRSLMAANFSTGNTGDPDNFVSFLKKKASLPAAPWKTYYPGGSIKPIAKRIHDNVKKGLALSYCYPPHCVAIYGGVFDGDKELEYHIADSIGGKLYKVNAAKALGKLDLIMTRE